MAVAEPAQPLRLPASLSLYQRWGLGEREGDSEGSSSSVRGGLGVHTALLEARTRQRWGEGSDDVAPAGHAGRFREQVNWQRCAFVLDLVMAQPPPADAGGLVQPVRHNGGRSSSSGSGSGSRREVAASHGGGSAATRQADAAQGDGYEDDSSASWEARHEVAGAPAAAGSGLMLQGALSSRDCGIRLALALAPIKVDEYHSKAVSFDADIRTFQPASPAAALPAGALPEAGACVAAPGHVQPPAHLPLKNRVSISAAPQVNYTLMVTAMGFLQVLLLVRQMEAVSTQALASRVSLLSLAQQVGPVCRDCCHLALTGLLARKGAPPMARVPCLASILNPTTPALCCPPAGRPGRLPLPGAPHAGRGGGQPAAQLRHHRAHAVW